MQCIHNLNDFLFRDNSSKLRYFSEGVRISYEGARSDVNIIMMEWGVCTISTQVTVFYLGCFCRARRPAPFW